MKIHTFFSVILSLLFLTACGQVKPVNTTDFVSIGGIEQWVTIRGTDCSKPVVLFLHGGPGSPLTPYADAIFKGWEKDLVLVQWDQRGAGKTFGTYAPEELDPEFLASHPLSLDQMVNDGIELAEYLRNRLGKKLILFGTSWGSVLGAKMAAARPDLFYAYIGHSQLVHPEEDNKYTYRKLRKLVQAENDEESLQLLDSIGPPPYDIARHTGQFIRVIKKYERRNATPFPEEWANIPSEYSDPENVRIRGEGDDYSFLSYAGDRRFGIMPMSTSINLLEDTYQFEIPVYLLQGEDDILTPVEKTKAYYEKIEAPEKQLIMVAQAAHGFTPQVIAALHKLLMEEIVPEIGKGRAIISEQNYWAKW